MKNNHSVQYFHKLLIKLKEIKDFQSRLEYYEDTYSLKRYRISQIYPNKASSLLENITKKFYKQYDKQNKCSIWFENQLRLFIWIFILYAQLSKKTIHEFMQKDWQFFADIFRIKQTYLFQYQARIIFDYAVCLQKWSQKQDSLLIKLVTDAKKIKWNEIAKLLFASSQRIYTRTSKQCRERWLNHLDPCKSKNFWSLQEERILLEVVLEKGKKWASLVQILKGKRSQHTIKNKYNSMLMRQTKMTPSLSETQNCRQIIQKIDRILIGNQIDVTDEMLFGESVKIIKQQQYTEQLIPQYNQQLQHTLSLGNDHKDNQNQFIQNSETIYCSDGNTADLPFGSQWRERDEDDKQKLNQNEKSIYSEICKENDFDSLMNFGHLGFVCIENQFDF